MVNLVGLYYPVRNAETDEIIAKRKITSAKNVENVAGIAITLTNPDSLILIGYSQIQYIVENQKEFETLMELT